VVNSFSAIQEEMKKVLVPTLEYGNEIYHFFLLTTEIWKSRRKPRLNQTIEKPVYCY